MRLTLLAVGTLDLAPILGLRAVAREMTQLLAVAAGYSGRVARLDTLASILLRIRVRIYLSAFLAVVSWLRTVAAGPTLWSTNVPEPNTIRTYSLGHSFEK